MRCACSARWRWATSARTSRRRIRGGATPTAARSCAIATLLLRERGWALGNADITVICERPKIGPHAVAMRAMLADDLGVDVDAVSVKATTTETLGFTGRGEGIAAQAVCLLVRA